MSLGLASIASFLAVRGFGPRLVLRLFARFLGLPWWARIGLIVGITLLGWWMVRRNGGGRPPWAGLGRRIAA